MTTTTTTDSSEPTLRQIRLLREEAIAAGDDALAETCLTVLAYGGGEVGMDEVAAARRTIARVLRDAAAQVER